MGDDSFFPTNVTSMRVTKAVIAAGGLGSRLLPATTVLPKELFPVVDRPVLHYIVAEVIASGIREIIVVTRQADSPMEAYFRRLMHDAANAEAEGRPAAAGTLGRLLQQVELVFVPQPPALPYGNGSPLLAAQPLLGDAPCAYLFGDDLVLSERPCLQQLLEVFEEHLPAAVLACQQVGPHETSLYGIVKPRPGVHPMEVESIVEKPQPGDAPSQLAQLGRFVLTPGVVKELGRLSVTTGGELWLTSALDMLCQRARVIAHPIDGQWFPVGDPLQYVVANVAYGLNRAEVQQALEQFLYQHLREPR